MNIVNVKKGPKCRYLYIGRKNKFYNLEQSIFANPFVIGRDGNRAQVIEKFEKYARSNQIILDNLHVLDEYQFLGCWCDYPEEDCHGRILIKLRNEQNEY